MESISLPQELVNEILLRLPVKELLRCKCVCKQWYALVESSSFIKQHYNHERRLLIRLKKPSRRGYKYALYVDETFSNNEEPPQLQIPEVDHSYLIDDLEIPEDDHPSLIGPLNGVFCVADGGIFGPFALFNPALRQFKPMPRLDPRISPSNLSLIGSEVGLGLDPLTGAYKLVSILYFWGSTSNVDYYLDYCSVACVCSSDSDSWRLLEDIDPIVSKRMANTSSSNTYLNGVYYWLLEFKFDDSSGADRVAMVLAFDMRTEKFRRIEVRGGVSETEAGTLALCGDSLTLLMFDRDKGDRCIDVWVMRDEESWIRSAKVGPLQENMYWVLCFWRNNELLLETMDNFLAVYNVSTKELRAIEAQKADGDRLLNWSYVYKETLASIEGEAAKCMLWDPSSDLVANFFKHLSI